MRATLFVLLVLFVLLASSCRSGSPDGADASLPKADATSDVDAAPAEVPAPSSLDIPPRAPAPDYRPRSKRRSRLQAPRFARLSYRAFTRSPLAPMA